MGFIFRMAISPALTMRSTGTAKGKRNNYLAALTYCAARNAIENRRRAKHYPYPCVGYFHPKNLGSSALSHFDLPQIVACTL